MTPRAAHHPKVRMFLLTRGRTRSARPLLVHTLVSVHYDPMVATTLTPELRHLYQQAHTTGMCSVAELSAACGVPLGVTRVLVADLAVTGQLKVHPDNDGRSARDLYLLERLRAGLRRLA